MDEHRRTALAQASVPCLIGGFGLLALSSFNSLIFAVTAGATLFVYRSSLRKSRNAAKYGMPPSKLR